MDDKIKNDELDEKINGEDIVGYVEDNDACYLKTSDNNLYYYYSDINDNISYFLLFYSSFLQLSSNAYL